MARLETQINQIYLTHSEHKKNSLILYEEQLTSSLQLFMVAELYNIQKRSESTDLKKISEIILASFRGNKKLPAETLFETSLSQINQNLADLAHAGRKSWVGKFSCLICIKGLDNNIFLANNGQTSAWLKRKSEMMEILPSENRGTHPLKTFINFTQGKLTDNDSLILTTANIFNYISFELFSRLLDQRPLEQATEEITKILRDSLSEDAAFSSFLLYFVKKPLEEIATTPKTESTIYAPLPEEMPTEPTGKPKWRLHLPKLPNFSFKLPAVKWEWIKKTRFPNYFQNLSRAGKFFFISFAVFLLLFLINLGFYAFKLQGKKTQSRTDQLVLQINNSLAQTQSALIYKDEKEALKKLGQATTNLTELAKLDPIKAAELNPKVEQIKTVLNKINTVNDPKVYVELKHHPIYLSYASIGFLFANQDSNSLSLYNNKTLIDYFLLNSVKSPITSIAYFPPAGVVVSTKDAIYKIDQTLKQFTPVLTLADTNIKSIKVANNALYALGDGKLTKITTKYKVQTVISGNFTNARDFGLDKDLYVLYSDKIIKYVAGQPQTFHLPNMSEPLTNGDKLLVGANIYVLESNKKRLIVINKTGVLINQIYFPTTNSLSDFYIDEASRSIYLLDDNKLYKITF
ncbi:MAG TPA: hypothetical protein VF974_00080 [Patescibacteria group bacterium]